MKKMLFLSVICILLAVSVLNADDSRYLSSVGEIIGLDIDVSLNVKLTPDRLSIMTYIKDEDVHISMDQIYEYYHDVFIPMIDIVDSEGTVLFREYTRLSLFSLFSSLVVIDGELYRNCNLHCGIPESVYENAASVELRTVNPIRIDNCLLDIPRSLCGIWMHEDNPILLVTAYDIILDGFSIATEISNHHNEQPYTFIGGESTMLDMSRIQSISNDVELLSVHEASGEDEYSVRIESKDEVKQYGLRLLSENELELTIMRDGESATVMLERLF